MNGRELIITNKAKQLGISLSDYIRYLTIQDKDQDIANAFLNLAIAKQTNDAEAIWKAFKAHLDTLVR